nr:hypothetical protein [Tanacetum cinerariifolium]
CSKYCARGLKYLHNRTSRGGATLLSPLPIKCQAPPLGTSTRNIIHRDIKSLARTGRRSMVLVDYYKDCSKYCARGLKYLHKRTSRGGATLLGSLPIKCQASPLGTSTRNIIHRDIKSLARTGRRSMVL